MEEVCLDSLGSPGDPVKVMDCHEGRGNQEWFHDRVQCNIFSIQILLHKKLSRQN